MCYTRDKSARFVGMQRFTGTLGRRQGGFVLQTDGEFDGSVAKATWSIVPGSGTGSSTPRSRSGPIRADR